MFGCIPFALISYHKLHKLNEKSEKYMFIGYSSESKAYRLYKLVSCEVIVSRDIVFHEGSRWSWDAMHGRELVIGVQDEYEGPVDIMHDTQNAVNTAEEANESPRQSEPVLVNESLESRVMPTDGSPPRKTKLLADIYNTCAFA